MSKAIRETHLLYIAQSKKDLWSWLQAHSKTNKQTVADTIWQAMEVFKTQLESEETNGNTTNNASTSTNSGNS